MESKSNILKYVTSIPTNKKEKWKTEQNLNNAETSALTISDVIVSFVGNVVDMKSAKKLKKIDFNLK